MRNEQTSNSPTSIALLSSSLELPCGVVVPNRLVKVALSECLSRPGAGQAPNQRYRDLYATCAEGGWGMIITGNVQVCPRHLGFPFDLNLPPAPLPRDVLDKWTAYAALIKSGGSLAIMQLCHTGRQSTRGAGRWPHEPPLAPSSLKVEPGKSLLGKLVGAIVFNQPKEMQEEDFYNVKKQFVNSAKIAKEAGFDGVELHCSHGYLLASLLSPKTNQRKDQYGGSGENRLRFLIEVINDIRRFCPPPFALGVKLNSADYVDGGLTEEHALENVRMLAANGGIDFIEISGGTYENPYFVGRDDVQQVVVKESTKKREGIFRNFAARAKSVLPADSKVVIMLTGGLRSREGMAEVVSSSTVDLIGLGRPACLDPCFPASTLLNPSIPDSEAVCLAPPIPGLTFLKRIFPIVLVGAGFETLWYTLQLHRVSRRMKPNHEYGFGSLLLTIIFGDNPQRSWWWKTTWFSTLFLLVGSVTSFTLLGW
ncbi:FMN-linked oxidoreductase [Atractiella rhizophila]|nr:FMN-linked oxidoreductase [Atractiella rhizophila]